MLSGELESLQAGPVRMRWRRTAAEVRKNLDVVDLETVVDRRTGGDATSDEQPHADTAPTGSLIAELASLAEQSPEAAILEGHSRVEMELRRLLSSPPVDPHLDLNRLGTHTLADLAHQRGFISAETQRAVEGLGVMRNLAMHGRASDATHEQAIQYLVLVDGALFAIRMDRAKCGVEQSVTR